MSAFYDFAQLLYDSDFGTALRESQYAFPIIEGTHLLGLAFSVGLLAIVDLRLAGVLLREEPLLSVLRALRPFVLAGFVLTFATGFLLFWALSIKLLANPIFAIKFVFILLAGANFLWFELVLAPKASEWADDPLPPRNVRAAGWTSLVLWTLVVMAGRLIPYLGES